MMMKWNNRGQQKALFPKYSYKKHKTSFQLKNSGCGRSFTRNKKKMLWSIAKNTWIDSREERLGLTKRLDFTIFVIRFIYQLKKLKIQKIRISLLMFCPPKKMKKTTLPFGSSLFLRTRFMRQLRTCFWFSTSWQKHTLHWGRLLK